MEYNVNKFKELLLSENQKYNLISRQSNIEDINNHIQDSIKVLDFCSIEGKSIIDIGSGAGFPGFVLALFMPSAWFNLVESDLKKSDFLKKAVDELCLDNVQVIRDRIENLGQNANHREQYDYCTSRAVAAMNTMLEYALPMVKVNGQVLLWKGPGFEEEIDQSREALKILGGELTNIYRYNLSGNKTRVILVVKKVMSTPRNYPRRVGIPTKRPL